MRPRWLPSRAREWPTGLAPASPGATARGLVSFGIGHGGRRGCRTHRGNGHPRSGASPVLRSASGSRTRVSRVRTGDPYRWTNAPSALASPALLRPRRAQEKGHRRKEWNPRAAVLETAPLPKHADRIAKRESRPSRFSDGRLPGHDENRVRSESPGSGAGAPSPHVRRRPGRRRSATPLASACASWSLPRFVRVEPSSRRERSGSTHLPEGLAPTPSQNTCRYRH